MKDDLILEIGTEELPPSCTRSGLQVLKQDLGDRLKESHIGFEHISVYNSPRRLTALVKGINARQDTIEKTVTGPPKKIALDKQGKPNKAAIGFARSLGLDADELEEIEIENRGVYLGKRIKQEGKKTSEVLPDLLRDTILSLNFNKQMSWGDHDIRFIRPIRWILAIMGSRVIKFDIGNVGSGNITYGHRTLNRDPIKIDSAGDYFDRLEHCGNVIADPARREKMILDQVRRMEKEVWDNKYRAVIKKELLDDVVDLVEIPNVLNGSFPEDFLYIPRDILLEAIQYHQKYFPVLDSKGRTVTNFLIVQNGLEDNGEIKKGNERVLRARLSDATFFYEQDKKHGFDFWRQKLEGVIFYSGLGSMGQKQERLNKISSYLAGKTGDGGAAGIPGSIEKACAMCKCDLVTNLVVEFPELQGIVGKEYAIERGFEKEVSAALFEHYLPRSPGDELPSTVTGSILSLADRMDTITGMFLAGNIASGSEDPFALRRRASGIVRIILDRKYDIDLRQLADFCIALYRESSGAEKTEEAGAGDIFEFIQARQRFMMSGQGKRMDVLDAVMGSGTSSILDIGLRCDAIWDHMEEKDIKAIVWPMSRSLNIIKGKAASGTVDEGLFRENLEKELLGHVKKAEKETERLMDGKKYKDILKVLEKLGITVDRFFDEILVMDRDKKVRQNRFDLLKRTADLYMRMADFSRIIIEDGMK